MRFFEYNNQIVNLSQVTNFSCQKDFVPYQGENENFRLRAHLGYSHGTSEKEERSYDAAVELGEFTSKADGLQVVRNIIAGKYDLPVGTENITEDVEPLPQETDPETETETPAETETESTEEQEQTQETPDDPAAKEKAIENARAQFKLEQTKVVAGELNIDTVKIYGEAQRVWGDSDTWNTAQWENYIVAIADFQQRKGVLYDRLKPQQQAETKANGNGGKRKGSILMKTQGWGKKFTVKPYGTSYSHEGLKWFGTFYNLPRIGWYWASQFLS